MIRDFKRLDVWRLSIEFNKMIYSACEKFPASEIYGLTSQIKRACISISSNIAEGCGRSTDKDFVLFLHHAMGSLKEVRCQIYLARELGFIEEEFVKIDDFAFGLERKLFAFISHIKKTS